MPKQNTSLLFLFLGLGLAISLTFIFAWTEPTANPPGDNVPAPLNVSTTGQYKTGKLGVNTTGIDAGYGLTVGALGVKATGNSRFEGTISGNTSYNQAGQSADATISNQVAGLNADYLDGYSAAYILAQVGSGGGCYVSYGGGCLAGFTSKGSVGTYGKCWGVDSSSSHFRPPSGSCPSGWNSSSSGEAYLCCQ